MTPNAKHNSPPRSDPRTLLVHGGRDPHGFSGMVNTPVHRGSTILSRDLESWQRDSAGNPYAQYGRFGTPTTRSLEDMVARLEGGYRSLVFPSGLSACCHALMSVLKAGDHVLMTNSVYGPVRLFTDQVLKRFNIEVSFYDPLIGGNIRSLMRPNTRAVYVESPGSWSFEVQDIPAITHEAHLAGAVVIMDNSWASPLFFQPFTHGVDISVQAATKYLVGHSDALLGVATASEAAWPLLQRGAHDFGQTAGPDDIFLTLRGIRTLDVRLQRHWETGLLLAESLLDHKIVKRVMHPALPQDPGHMLWKRDFTGASGLFGVVLHPVEPHVVHALFERLNLFGIGLSWGGFESLVMLSDKPVSDGGHAIRIHAGLESAADLIDDMRQAFCYACSIA
ncbi:MAG: Cystathionine beta-lyase [Rhizobium sp.]|nr:Cystathionine beta-lyase [Rhizobium sp.]